MIRFCDKEVYNITEGEWTKAELLEFFLQSKENRRSVIAVYREDGTYKGVITYRDLLAPAELENCINTAVQCASERFWEAAKEYFDKQPGRLLPVVNEAGEIQGFAYNERSRTYAELTHGLSSMETGKFFLPEQYNRVQLVVITDLNELAWKCYLAFSRKGYAVCLMGEKWEWFGIKTGQGYMDYPDFAKMYIYAEGTQILRAERDNQDAMYDSVAGNFKFIYEICSINEKIVYRMAAQKLVDKGISLCECCLPELTELKYLTVNEKFTLGKDEYELVRNPEYEACAFDVFGKETVEAFRKDDYREKRTSVPMGEGIGLVLEEMGFTKRIYMLGPCIVGGGGNLENERLYAMLQNLVKSKEYQVVAVPIPHYRFAEWETYLENLPLREKDVVLIVNNRNWFGLSNRWKRLDLKSLYDAEGRESMFRCWPIHSSPQGNRIIAEAIEAQYLRDELNKLAEKQSNHFIQWGGLLQREARLEIEDYIEQIKVDVIGEVGGIVMNCNPFTKGHRYLIEYAASNVDKLYVFVVQENRSFFEFADRFEMVKRGTADLGNVTVVPSGKWVLSYKTMPCYFEKEHIQEMTINARLDIEIFARYIAPPLGITKRFVGEEPIDLVTRQYNEQMSELLPLYGVELEEIPRLRMEGELISASRVRRCMEVKDWQQLQQMVPQSTYEVLMEKYRT